MTICAGVGKRYLSANDYETMVRECLANAAPGFDREYVTKEIASWAQTYREHRMAERAGELVFSLGGKPFRILVDSKEQLPAVARLHQAGILSCSGFRGFMVDERLLRNLGSTRFTPYDTITTRQPVPSEETVFLLGGATVRLDHPRCISNDYRETYIDLVRFNKIENIARNTRGKVTVLYPLYREIHTVAILAGHIRRSAGDRLTTIAVSPEPLLDGDYDHAIVEPFRYLWLLIFRIFSSGIYHINVGWGIQALPFMPFVAEQQRVVLDFYEILSFLPDAYFEKMHSTASQVLGATQYLFQHYPHVIHLCSDEITHKLKKKYGISTNIVSVTEYLQPPIFDSMDKKSDIIRIVYGGYMLRTNSPNDLFYKPFLNVAHYFSQKNLHLYLYNSPYLVGLKKSDGLQQVLREHNLSNIHECTPLPGNEFTKAISEYDYGAMFIRPKDMNGADYNYFMAYKFISYLRAGLPVIIDADNHFMADLVKKYNIGVVLEDEDYPRLAEILNAQNLAELKANVAKCRSDFSIDKGAGKVMAIYEEILCDVESLSMNMPSEHVESGPNRANCSSPLPQCQGLPEVHPEKSLSPPPAHSGLSAVEGVDLRSDQFQRMLLTAARAEKRLYYRDQTPESLQTLVNLVQTFKPTVIVELGTCSGMSLRAWLAADSSARIYAVDISFDPLRRSLQYLPADLSRVRGIEQDIMTVDYQQLWGAVDRVLLYADAHDLPNVPIMRHVLYNIVPLLPPNALVAVDDLWYNPELLSAANADSFFKKTVIPQFDPIIYRELQYAPYWKGGSFVGFSEVVQLMDWANRYHVPMHHAPQVKTVFFSPPPKADMLAAIPSIPASAFAQQVGIIKPRPIPMMTVAGPVTPVAQEALGLCREGIALYEDDRPNDALSCFRRATELFPGIQGVRFAQAVCLSRTGNFESARSLLKTEMAAGRPPPEAAALLSDIEAWCKRCTEPPSRQFRQAPTLTLFAVPKAFRGHVGTIQRNAIRSWTRIEPQPEIILFGDEDGTAEIAREHGLRHVSDVAKNEYGTPLINAIFTRAQELATNSLLCYLNADIIVTPDFASHLQPIEQERTPHLVVGRRWDLAVWEELDFTNPAWAKEILNQVRTEGLLHGSTGIDYFIFLKGLFVDFPPFAVGRPGWDNWLLWHASQRGARLVEATRLTPVIHQDHAYTHRSHGFKEQMVGEESQKNRRMAVGKCLTILDTGFVLSEQGIAEKTQTDLMPEPSLEDLVKHKMKQALKAFDQGMFAECLDFIYYIELHLADPCLNLPSKPKITAPSGMNLLRAQANLQLGQEEEALAAVRHELALYPGNIGALRSQEFLEALIPKKLQRSPLITPSHSVQSTVTSCNLTRHSILFVNTYYGRFLENHYRKHPDLGLQSYAFQKSSLQSERFGDSDFYSEGMKRAGWQSDNLIINCAPLQQTWAHENGCDCGGFQLVAEQVRRIRPHVVYIQDMNMIPPEFLSAIRTFSELIVGQIATPVVKKIPFAQYDIIISSFPHYVTKLRAAGLTAYYQPLAFDPRALKGLPVHPYSQRPVACSFVGGVSALHIYGNQLLDHLARQTPIEFWGYGVESLPADSPIRSRHHGEAWGKEMFSILCESRVTLNRHGEVAENYANNMRLFEATGCGALMVTDYKDNLNELFEIGKEVVAYRSLEECATLIDHYLANPGEAEKIAHAGQARTLLEHTYPKRMEQTAEILDRHLRYQREKKRFPDTDVSRISYGHTLINETEVSEEMTRAWKDRSIPAKQRALVQQELAGMYRGKIAAPFRALADILQPHTFVGCSVLEIGCASGYYCEILEYLLRRRIHYTGVDYSDALIGMAKDYYSKRAFHVADGARLPFKESEFRIAISSGILLHVPNYPDHIAETARVAEHFVVAHRTPVCRRRPNQYMKKLAYGIETVEILFNEEQLLAEFDSHGLKLLTNIEYLAAPRQDEYGVTYLFEKQSVLARTISAPRTHPFSTPLRPASIVCHSSE